MKLLGFLYCKFRWWIGVRKLKRFINRFGPEPFERLLEHQGFRCTKLGNERIWRKGASEFRILESTATILDN